MIRDGDVLVAEAPAGSTIASTESRPSLHVECMWRSPRMSARATSVRQRPRQGGRDLVVAVPDFGRDERKTERAVDLFFPRGGTQRAVGRKQPVRLQTAAIAFGERADRVHVLSRACHMKQRGASFRRHGKADAHLRAIHPQVHATRAPVERADDVGWMRRDRRSRARGSRRRRPARCPRRFLPPSQRSSRPSPIRRRAPRSAAPEAERQLPRRARAVYEASAHAASAERQRSLVRRSRRSREAS